METSVLLLRLEIKKVSLFEKLVVTTAGSAARLERSSFLRNEVEQKKREWKAEMSAPIKEIINVQNKKMSLFRRTLNI